MDSDSFCVRYRGQILQDFDKPEVCIALTSQFGMSEKQCLALTGHKNLVVRKNLSKQRAIRTASKLRDCGVDAVASRQERLSQKSERSSSLTNQPAADKRQSEIESTNDSHEMSVESNPNTIKGENRSARHWLVIGLTGLAALGILAAFIFSAPSLTR